MKLALPSRRLALVALAVAAALLLAGALGYWLGAARDQAPAAGERRVLYWYDPMRPEVHFDRPGRSPFMDMDLVPRYADEAAADAGVRIEPGVAQNLGVRLADVERTDVSRTVLAAGVIAFSERSLAVVQARTGGFVERGYGRAVGDVVAAGAPLVDIRVPEWAAAQAEYLALRAGGGDLAQAARRRLAMLGMPAALIARVEREGAPRPVFTATSPVPGAIVALDVRPGMTVASGAGLASINGLSPVWLIASLPQADAQIARAGATVAASVPAFPGESFAGRVESVLPSADAATRTIEARISLANPQGRLRPGMTAEARLHGPAHSALTIPAEAAIRTGLRSIVIVAQPDNSYLPVEVTLGRQHGDRIEIASGLAEGQRVVASGQFLIDSEASLTGALERLNASAASAGPLTETTGRIAGIDGDSLMIAHPPIPPLNWPAMTMQFKLARPQLAEGLAAGDTVAFGFRRVGDDYVIETLRETQARR